MEFLIIRNFHKLQKSHHKSLPPSYVHTPQIKYLLQRYHGYRWLTTDAFYQENTSIHRAEMMKDKIPNEHIRVIESTNGRTGSVVISL